MPVKSRTAEPVSTPPSVTVTSPEGTALPPLTRTLESATCWPEPAVAEPDPLCAGGASVSVVAEPERATTWTRAAELDPAYANVPG